MAFTCKVPQQGWLFVMQYWIQHFGIALKLSSMGRRMAQQSKVSKKYFSAYNSFFKMAATMRLLDTHMLQLELWFQSTNDRLTLNFL
jgi:hypothetical protein